MFRIKTMNKIAAVGLDRLERERYVYADDMTKEQGILVRSASLLEMEFPKSLMAIARAGAGVNNIPIDRCSEQGIVVFNTPGANANAVKEMVMAGLLISARKVFPAMEWVQQIDEEEDVTKTVEKGKSKFAGPELTGKTLGVIGLGAVGIQVANLAIHFGMKVYGYDPYLSVDQAWQLAPEIIRADKVEKIYEVSDFITLHVPQTPQTKGMICRESIEKMKDRVRILNFARGGLVEDADMLQALEEKKVYCYVTDFPSADLLGHKGVLAIPHLGASTPESEDNCARMAVDELKDYLENGNIRNSVNLPTVHLERSGAMRIGCIHQNVPNMLTQISQCISAAGINIENLTNKSKGDYAYTLVDIQQEATEEMLEKMRQIEGVIRVNTFA